MDSTRDFSRIIHSPSFTFLVGPKHVKLTIQSGLAQRVSKPLHNLMNNGRTCESKHRIAVLEDENVETFVAFCEYAYTGDYTVPPILDTLEEDHCPPVERGPGVGHPWAGPFTSDSVSSVTRPPAPSPSPNMKTVGQDTVRTEPEPEPVPLVEELKALATEDQQRIRHQHGKTEAPGPLDRDAVPDAIEAAEELFPADPLDAPDEHWLPPWSPAREETTKKTDAILDDPSTHLTPPSSPSLDQRVGDNSITPNSTSERNINAENVDTAGSGSQHGQAALDQRAAHWEQSAPISPGVGEPHGQLRTEDRHDGGEKSLPAPMIDMSFAKQQDSAPRKPGLSLWDEFADLEYVDGASTCKSSRPNQSLMDLPYLTFHAKVYVFATRYLIPALAQLCLRKLHGDLLHLSLSASDTGDLAQKPQNLARKVQMVLDLLHYTYTNTARLEPISPTSATQLRENELRRLVVHYAACTVKDLARHHLSVNSEAVSPSVRPVDARLPEHTGPRNLRALLDMTPELSSDLVYRIM